MTEPDLSLEIVGHCPVDDAECRMDERGWKCPTCRRRWDLEGRYTGQSQQPVGDVVHRTRIPLDADPAPRRATPDPAAALLERPVTEVKPPAGWL